MINENELQLPPTEKPKLASATNWVAILSPVIIAILTAGGAAVGLPIPPEIMAAIVPLILSSTVQSLATWIARNRKGGGGRTRGIVIPG